MGRRGAEPEEPARLGLRKAHNRAIRNAAANQRTRETQTENAVDVGRRVARWWRNAVAAMPERFERWKDRAAHYWRMFIDRGGGHDPER
jgi:hypothetical protein